MDTLSTKRMLKYWALEDTPSKKEFFVTYEGERNHIAGLALKEGVPFAIIATPPDSPVPELFITAFSEQEEEFFAEIARDLICTYAEIEW